MQARKKLCLKKKPEKRDDSKTDRQLHLSSREQAPQIQNQSSRLQLELPTTSSTSSSTHQKWTPLPATKLLIDSAPEEPQKETMSKFEEDSVKKWTPLPPPNMELLTRQPVIMLKWEDSDTDVEIETKTMTDLEQSRNEIIDTGLNIVASNSEPVQLHFEENSNHSSVVDLEDVSSIKSPLIENSTDDDNGGRDEAELFGEREFDAFYTSVDKFMDMSSDEDLPSVSWMKSPAKKKPKIEHQHRDGTSSTTEYKTKSGFIRDSEKSDSGFVDRISKSLTSKAQSMDINNSARNMSTGTNEISNIAEACPVSHYSKSSPSTSSATETSRGGDLVTERCPMCNTNFPLTFTQCDADEHIAICLSVNWQDF